MIVSFHSPKLSTSVNHNHNKLDKKKWDNNNNGIKIHNYVFHVADPPVYI